MWSQMRTLTLKLLARQPPAALANNIIDVPIISRTATSSIETRGLSRQCSSWSVFGRSLTSSINSSNLLDPWSSSGSSSLRNNMEGTSLQGPFIVPSRGMKIKGRVKRRCKDCYLIWIEGILHNLCKAHPRHKQMLKPKYWANTRILTHATSGFKRPW